MIARRKALLGMNITTVVYLIIFIACIAIGFALVLKVTGRLSTLLGEEWKSFAGIMNTPVIGTVARGILKIVNFISNIL